MFPPPLSEEDSLKYAYIEPAPGIFIRIIKHPQPLTAADFIEVAEKLWKLDEQLGLTKKKDSSAISEIDSEE
jgi:hypothetical protein